MAELRWTDEAVTWLEDTRDYIARDDPAAARRVCLPGQARGRGDPRRIPRRHEYRPLSAAIAIR